MPTRPDPPAAALCPREDLELSERLALSAATSRGAHLATEDVTDWLDERHAAGSFHARRIPLTELVERGEWRFEPGTGNLAHRSGGFFTVEGMRVAEGTGEGGPRREWEQPVISQPEVGVLGLLAKEFGGVLHFLMQAKAEPGNPRPTQLSPTVQATRSNYTRAHRGADVRLLDHFVGPGAGRVLVDVLQSEQGSWFFRKSNRNVIVETDDEVDAPEDFRWLTLGQIAELLHRDEVVNMDARSVLSCVPHGDPTPRALLSDAALLSWFTGERGGRAVRARRIPLSTVRGWKHGVEAIEHEDGRYFRVVAVSVRAGNREVSGWTQPLIEPVGTGVAAFLLREIDSIPHVLVHARTEGGFLDTVELGPTVQCTPGNHAHLPLAERPRYLEEVLTAPPSRVRYGAVHSEEGGRFLNARCRYLVIDADPRTARLDPPPGFAWATPAQLTALTRHGHYLNVEARTLLACLHAMAARS
ncbi:NDP-hexose 2,3-dehydratase family protein [Streptomyces sp. ZYX-F-203]